MDKLISTLRVFRQKKNTDLSALRTGNAEDPNFADATFNPNTSLDLQVNRTKKRTGGGEGGDDMTLIIVILIVAAVAGLILKGRKKKKGKKKQ